MNFSEQYHTEGEAGGARRSPLRAKQINDMFIDELVT